MKPTPEIQAFLAAKGETPLKDGVLASDFLKRPEVKYADLIQFIPAVEGIDNRVVEQVEIQIKYAGYIDKEKAKIAKLKRMEAKKIPANIDYDAIEGLATEGRQKLQKKFNPKHLRKPVGLVGSTQPISGF